MKIDNLTLMNFRNYESLNISFGDLNIIYGLNGSGKTNIIEAIYTLALTKELVGRVRSKFSVEGSPYTLDGNTLLQEAAAEKTNLENQLIGEIYIL